MYPHHFGGYPGMPYGVGQDAPYGNGMPMGQGMPFGGGVPPVGFVQPPYIPLENVLMPQRMDPRVRPAVPMGMPRNMLPPGLQNPYAFGSPGRLGIGEAQLAGRDHRPRMVAPAPGRDFTPRPAHPSPDRQSRHDSARVRFSQESLVPTESHNRRTRHQYYEKIQNLRTGGMSVAINILRGRDDRKLYIEKRICMDGSINRRRAVAEVNTLKVVRGHPNLNQLIESKTTDSGLYSMILEYCDCGSLQDKMQMIIEAGCGFKEVAIFNVLLGVSRALAFLHQGIKAGRTEPVPGWKAIAHLDIKPGNILISSRGGEYGQERVVLADFGCAVSTQDLEAGRETDRRQPCGTPQWYPPEGREGNGYGTRTDLYMLGATIHTLCQRRPIPSLDLPNWASPCGNRYSRELNQIVRKSVQTEWRERPSARKVVPEALYGLQRSIRQDR